MILVVHILIALLSVIQATDMFFRPSESKFKPAYFLVAATLVSGTVLVVERSSHLVESCLTGLLYLACVSFAIALSHRKLAISRQK